MSQALVMFTVPEKRLREMAISTGPCVPVGDRKRAMCGVLTQDHSEGPEHTASLFKVLAGGRPDDALELVAQDGGGALYVCTPEFVAAMARANEELCGLADQDDASGDRTILPLFTQRAEQIAAEWLKAGDWPRSLVSLWNRVPRMGLARVALENEQNLYAWYGPAVPTHVIVSGSGPYPGKPATDA